MAEPKTTFDYVGEIWSIADWVRDVIRPADYNKLILPFALLRRLECALEPTRDAVCKAVEQHEREWGLENETYCAFSGRSFYNVTSFRLNDLGADNTLDALMTYVDGFSPNARDILTRFKIRETCQDLQNEGMLHEVCMRFAGFDLSPETVSDRMMSDIYEHLIQRYGEEIAQGAEDFMTPRDVVRLAVSLVFANEDGFLNSDDGSMRTLYDGTCGFISDALDMLDEWKSRKPGVSPASTRPVRSGTRGRDLGGRQDQPVAAQHRQLGTGPVRRDARPFGAHHAGRHPFRRQVRGADVQLPADQPALRQGMEGRGTVRAGGGILRVQGTFRRGTARHRRRVHAVHPERRREARPRRAGRRQGRDRAVGLPAVQRGRGKRTVEHPPLAVREGLYRLHRETAHGDILPHRHQHVHLDPVEQETREP